MSDSQLIIFRRSSDEAPESFKRRLHDLSSEVARDHRASLVVLFIDDGEVGAPREATTARPTFDAAVVVSGVPAVDLPAGDARYEVGRRVIKARERGANGQRSTGFTIVCPTIRAAFLDHDQFDAYWSEIHSKVHVAWSSGTCHYEQLIIDESSTTGERGGPEWDGVGLLSFASAADYTEGLFNGPEGERVIMDDVARFADFSKGKILPTSEFVFCDKAL